MSYNDYPGVSDSYDSNESPEMGKLDAARMKRLEILYELGELQHEASFDGHTALGVYHRNIDDARLVRALRIDRGFRDLDRLDETIKNLMLENEPCDDITGYDPDSILDDAA